MKVLFFFLNIYNEKERFLNNFLVLVTKRFIVLVVYYRLDDVIIYEVDDLLHIKCYQYQYLYD